ncbi:unnamed protein product [Acanthoscelides obtectus]|uniref:Uncharacterized protein n=1 Tax=Acanthoscelides obtectus TaxID=200917 RepID=A0A9P0L5S6_ACAOB|nr:unnamed protein product [Acanthoscelides obtectus]CAK1626891.1 hypothetical protein AOBTE_LOCUS4137 [Acanthoscelides obtectus]
MFTASLVDKFWKKFNQKLDEFILYDFRKFPPVPPKSLPPARPMKFPYTFSAKIAQFPYRYYFKNQWIFHYYVYAVGLCIPIFMYISRLGEYYSNLLFEKLQSKI